jgi:hypothetical protein
LAIREQRTLELDALEVLRAITMAPQVASALGLQVAYEAVEFQPDEGAVVFVLDDKRQVIAAEALAALLVAYCSKIGIPLPRNGSKTIDVTLHSVILQVVVETYPCERGLSFQMVRPPRAVAWTRRHPL